jgi:hypothetical protein
MMNSDGEGSDGGSRTKLWLFMAAKLSVILHMF